MDPYLHGEEVCKFIEHVDNTRSHGLLLMPRGHGKTGMVTEPMPAWILSQNTLNRVLVCNAADNKAADMSRVSAGIIANHKLYGLCSPHVKQGDIWGNNGYRLQQVESDDPLSSSVDRTLASLSSLGLNSNITGAHVNRAMFLDDLINEKMAQFPEQVKRAERFFVEATTNCLDLGGTLIVCCTRWTYHDYSGKLVSGELTAGAGKLKVLKLGATRINSKGEHELIFPYRKYFDQNGQAQFSGFTKQKLEEAKANLKGLFSALYYNEPVLTEDQQFDTSLISTFPNHASLGFPLGNVRRVVVETASQAAGFAKQIATSLRKENKKMPLERLVPDQSENAKDIRIRSYIQGEIKNLSMNIRRDLMERDDNIGEEFRTYPKGHDDCFPAETPVITLAGVKPIVEVTTDDLVLTRNGFRRVLKAWCKGNREVITKFGITATPDHRIFTENRGWVILDDLNLDDVILRAERIKETSCEKPSSLMAENITDTQKPRKAIIENIIQDMINGNPLPGLCTEISGNSIMDQSPEDIKSTTGMGIITTTISPILNVSLGQHMPWRIEKNLVRERGRLSILPVSPSSENEPNYGTRPPKAIGGTPIKLEPQFSKSRKIEIVKSVGDCSVLTLGCRLSAESSVGEEERTGRELKIVPVYDLMVEEDHEFFAWGALVHNCLDSFSLLLDIMPDCSEKEIPDIYMVLDPAFSKESYSDFCAISVGTRYCGQAYLLDLIRFQTDDTDYICRILFNTFDRWNQVGEELMRPPKPRKRMGYRSRGSVSSRKRSNSSDSSFECDFTGFYTK